ncbi:DUF6530 family protein [uncultured Brevibacillus sp.]|uniref:DUF6530 family protein n=1 Tax=uncultured Brevibacillus sp. TaxID=169970 RepID=UPI00259ADFEA|nr:DUF6530 family protein [uncultured Brevibacillus sp.]
MKKMTASNHNPVIISENYDMVDGRFARSADAQSLSLGVFQEGGLRSAMVTAKVSTNTEENDSAQSEVLPFHRVLDLSILICRTLTHFRDAYRYEHFYDPEKPVLDRIGLQGAALNVAVFTDNENIQEDMKRFSQALINDDELIGERLRTLSRLVKEMGY